MNDQKELIQQLAEEYDLPTFVVESIVKSQFKFGVFKVKPKRLYIMNKDTDNGG